MWDADYATDDHSVGYSVTWINSTQLFKNGWMDRDPVWVRMLGVQGTSC